MTKKFLSAAFILLAASAFAGEVDISRIPNGFANSKVGDWVRYRTMMGDQVMTLTSVENEGENMVVKVRTDFYSGENQIRSSEDRIPLRSFFNAGDAPWVGEGVAIEDGSVDFKGAPMNVVIIRNPETNVLLQMSGDIPLVGIYKLEVEGEPMPIMELVDFGRN